MASFTPEKLEQTEQEKKAFDALPKGNAAALSAGVSPEFLEALIFAAEKQKCITVVRGSNALSPTESTQPYQPKPPWIKAKTTDWDFIIGLIAARPLIHLLGKRVMDEKTQTYKIITTSLGDIPDEMAAQAGELDEPLVYALQHTIKKDEITNHQILYQDINAIYLVANDDPHPKGQRILFKIDLTTRHDDGSFDVFCKSEALPDSTFQPVRILGMYNQKGDLVPVREDKDICLIAPAKKIIQSIGQPDGIPSAAMETYDTYTTGGRVSMLEGLRALNPKLNHQLTEMDVVQYGCITPFESILISLINHRYNKSHPLDPNPIQHSGENHNPEEKLANLTTTLLHIILGEDGKLAEIVTTETEKQFAYLSLSYAANYYFEIHPRWNMEYWAVVIEKQLLNGFSINAETMVNYLAYKYKESIPNSSDEKSYKKYIYMRLNERIILNDFSFIPIEHIYVSPIQKMSIWNQTIENQLKQLITIGPKTLLAYYQDQFKVTEAISKGKSQRKNLLDKNHTIFETYLIDIILKNNQATHVIIHPEFDLDKWLPVMIEQLEFSKNHPFYKINQNILDAYVNYLQKRVTVDENKLTLLKNNPTRLLSELKSINIQLSVKSKNKEKDLYTATLLTRKSTMRTPGKTGFQIGKEIKAKNKFNRGI